MTYNHTIEGYHITVTITDTTADAFLDAICDRMNLDVLVPSVLADQKEDFKEAVEEMAREYIQSERPQVDFWREDELETVDVLEVKIHCGRIFDVFEFYGDVSGIHYNQIIKGF